MRHKPVNRFASGKGAAVEGFVLAVGSYNVLARHFTNKPLHDQIQGVHRAARG